jgi:hypothetical protein
MRIADLTIKLLGLTEAMRKWQSTIVAADDRRRERIAGYAEAIADTLARTGRAFARLERKPLDQAALRVALREMGRLKGYVETILSVLDGRIDGRQLAGVKRRLESIASESLVQESLAKIDRSRIERLALAEGWFRAFADSLRVAD